nr:pyridine nucleotide-disulfide oxidoreductase [Pseudomonadota bacterium]
MTKMRGLGAALIATCVVAFFALDLGDYLTLEYLQSQHAHIEAYYTAHPCVTALAFSLIYTMTAGLSLPGSSLLPLLAGAVFGLFWGTMLVSVTSTIAATLEFLTARYL